MVKEKSKSSWTQWNKKTITVIAICLILIIGILALPEVEAEADDLEKIVTEQLGKKTNSKKDKVVEANVFDNEDGTHHFILTLNANENLTNNLTKRKMLMDSIDILKPLSEVEGTENISIEWLYPLKDQYGNVKDSRVILMNYSKEIRDRINWDTISPEDIPNTADEYFEHTVLSK